MSSPSEWLGSLAGGLNRAAPPNLDSLSARELLRMRSTIAGLRRSLDALDHRVLAIGARKDLHRTAGASSISELVATTNGVSRKEAAKSIKLAQHLENSPVLAQQMRKPGMSPIKAHLITEAVDKLPSDLTSKQKQHIEDELALAAPDMIVEQFKRKTRRALERIDRPRANQIENDELIAAEATALRRASFWMTRADSDGMVKGGFERPICSAPCWTPRRPLATEQSSNELAPHPASTRPPALWDSEKPRARHSSKSCATFREMLMEITEAWLPHSWSPSVKNR